MPTSCETAVADYFSAIRAMDTDRFVAVFAPDAVSHDPVGAPPHEGHDGIRAFFSGILAGFQSLALTEQSTFVNGNSAAVKWLGEGRQERQTRLLRGRRRHRLQRRRQDHPGPSLLGSRPRHGDPAELNAAARS